MKTPIKNIFALEPSQEQKVTLCQRVSNTASKYLSVQTDKQTNRQNKQIDIFLFLLVEINY